MVLTGKNVALLLAAGAAVVLVGGVGGYATRAATSTTAGPGDTDGEGAGADAVGGETEPAAGYGNGAELSYSRLDGASFLLVEDGDPVARLTPTSAEETSEGVAFGIAGEYLALDGELAVNSTDFFQYLTESEFAVPGLAVEEAAVYPAVAEDLAVLSPREPSQEFTFVLPDVPTTGSINYWPGDAVADFARLPICYEVGGEFTAEREACEEVPEPAS